MKKLLFVLLLAAALPVQATQYALLIGISDYIHGTRLDLDGPEQDLQMVEELLLTKFGYQAEKIKKLVNAEATKANILGGLSWLGKVAKPDDSVIIYYSGHGSQMYDRSGDEADRRDEVLVAADVQIGRPGKEVSDDEFKTELDSIAAKDILVLLDACNSGTGARDGDFGFGARPMQQRSVDLEYAMPDMPEASERSFDFNQPGVDGFEFGGSADGSRSLSDEKKVTIVASCQPDETSASTVFYIGGQRVWAGALTYYLVKALQKADSETTYGELMVDVVRDVKKVNRRQTPMVEGYIDRPVFAESDVKIDTRSYIRVTRVSEGRVEMHSDAFGREQVGSIFRVLDPQTGQTSGRVKVTRAVGRLIDGQIIEGEGKIKAPALAVEEFHALGGKKLHILVGDLGHKQINRSLSKKLERLSFVQLAATDSNYYDVMVAGKVEDSRFSLFSDAEVTAWIEEAGVRSRPVTSTKLDEIMTVLRPLLENAYAIKKLTQLDNTSPPFKVGVWATSTPKAEGPKSKFLDMKVGDPVYFHFRSERDAYLTLLNVDANGAIKILFPNEYMPFNRVVAGKTYTIPSEEMGFEIKIGDPGGSELVKAFATEFQMDLSGLNAQAVGGFRAVDFEAGDGYGPSLADDLTAALGNSFAGNIPEGTRAVMLSATPQAQGPPPGTPTENWATDYLIIESKK